MGYVEVTRGKIMLKKFLLILGVLMLIISCVIAGGAYYAYQHRQELTQKAVCYAVNKLGKGIIPLPNLSINTQQKPTATTDTSADSSGLGELASLFGGQNGNADLGKMAQKLISSFSGQGNIETSHNLTGNDINARDKKGRTLLMNICRTDASAKVVKMVLRYGADLNAVDNKGRTALMYAVALNQNPEVIALMVSAGASKKVRDYEGHSVYDYVTNDEVRAALKR